MSELPAYLLPRPAFAPTPETIAAFDEVLARGLAEGLHGGLDYRLDAPKWQFLSHLVETRPYLLHGSGDPSISQFVPRQPNDTTTFGNQNAVYAASDGIWPIFYAILDRGRFDISMINTASRLVDSAGRRSDPAYYFAISAAALAQRPFRRGFVYVLPRAGFMPQPPQHIGALTVDVAQWAALESVAPLLRLEVGPEDFPFLDAIRGFDPEPTFSRARAEPDGFPWLS